MSHAEQLSFFGVFIPSPEAWLVPSKPPENNAARILADNWPYIQEITCDNVVKRVEITTGYKQKRLLTAALTKLITEVGEVLITADRRRGVLTSVDPALLLDEDGSWLLVQHYTSLELVCRRPVKVLAFVFNDGSTFTIPA